MAHTHSRTTSENNTHTESTSKEGFCSVNSSFNATVGVIALIAAGIIGYGIYEYFIR